MKRGRSRHHGRPDCTTIARSPKSGEALSELERQLMLAEALIPAEVEGGVDEGEDSLAALNEQLSKAQEIMDGNAVSPVHSTPSAAKTAPAGGE